MRPGRLPEKGLRTRARIVPATARIAESEGEDGITIEGAVPVRGIALGGFLFLNTL